MLDIIWWPNPFFDIIEKWGQFIKLCWKQMLYEIKKDLARKRL